MRGATKINNIELILKLSGKSAIQILISRFSKLFKCKELAIKNMGKNILSELGLTFN